MNIPKLLCHDQKLAESFLKDSDLSFIQNMIFRIRFFCYTHFGVWELLDIFPYKYRDFYYRHIRTIFKPQHARLRKSIPKYWVDITSLVVDVNFEFIKSFYEDEYVSGTVDWEARKDQKKFARWLESAYDYITKKRPELEKQLDASYPEFNETELFCDEKVNEDGEKTYKIKSCEELYGKPYEEVYKEVNRIETLISKTDTKVLTEMIKYRDYFWT